MPLDSAGWAPPNLLLEAFCADTLTVMRALLGLSFVALAASAACFSAEARQVSPPKLVRPEQASASAVQVEAREYSFSLKESRMPAGTIDFVVRNSGQEDHEFVIVPVKNGRYDLPIGEIEAFAPGQTRAIQAELSPGQYEFACLMVSVANDEPQSHMTLGMQATFRVTE